MCVCVCVCVCVLLKNIYIYIGFAEKKIKKQKPITLFCAGFFVVFWLGVFCVCFFCVFFLGGGGDLWVGV